MKDKLSTYTLKLTFSDSSTTIFVDYGKTMNEPSRIDYKKELSDVIDHITYKRIDESFLMQRRAEFNDIMSKLFYDNRIFSMEAPKIDTMTNTISWEIQEKI